MERIIVIKMVFKFPGKKNLTVSLLLNERKKSFFFFYSLFSINDYPNSILLTIFRKSPTCGDPCFQRHFKRLRGKNFLFYSNQSGTMILPALHFIWHVFRKIAPSILTPSKLFADNHYYKFLTETFLSSLKSSKILMRKAPTNAARLFGFHPP